VKAQTGDIPRPVAEAARQITARHPDPPREASLLHRRHLVIVELHDGRQGPSRVDLDEGPGKTWSARRCADGRGHRNQAT
jgi:hypothetical protein